MKQIRLAVLLGAIVSPLAAQNAPSWDSVAAILQSPVTPAHGYTRFNFPRRDLEVRIGDVVVATALAGGAWVGFEGVPADAEMMGDLIFVPAELGPALRELGRNGIEVTAIHNHLVGEQPRLTYVHVHGHGSAATLARGIRAVIGLTATPLPVAAPAPAPLTVDTTLIFGALGTGRAAGAVAQVSTVLVRDTVRIRGRVAAPALAYVTPINIQAVSPTRYLATGDFSVTAANVEPVLHELAEHGITATALHSHLVDAQPPVYYIHFWADDRPQEVVAGLRAALGAVR